MRLIADECNCNNGQNGNNNNNDGEEEEEDDVDDFDVDFHHLLHATAKQLVSKFEMIVKNANQLQGNINKDLVSVVAK